MSNLEQFHRDLDYLESHGVETDELTEQEVEELMGRL